MKNYIHMLTLLSSLFTALCAMQEAPSIEKRIDEKTLISVLSDNGQSREEKIVYIRKLLKAHRKNKLQISQDTCDALGSILVKYEIFLPKHKNEALTAHSLSPQGEPMVQSLFFNHGPSLRKIGTTPLATALKMGANINLLNADGINILAQEVLDTYGDLQKRESRVIFLLQNGALVVIGTSNALFEAIKACNSTATKILLTHAKNTISDEMIEEAIIKSADCKDQLNNHLSGTFKYGEKTQCVGINSCLDNQKAIYSALKLESRRRSTEQTS